MASEIIVFFKNHSFLIYALIAITLLAGSWFTYIQWQKDTKLHSLFNSTRLRQQFLKHFNKTYRLIATIFLFFTLTYTSFIFLDPAWGRRERNIYIENIDILFVVDVSNSMNVTDVSPSRLEKAKSAMRLFASQLGGQRVGIVAFAASAFYYCPFTSDYRSFKEFVDGISPDMITNQGTNIDDVFKRVKEVFSNKKASAKLAIFISDGEIHGSIPSDYFEDDKGDKVTSIVWGVGTESGGSAEAIVEGFLTRETIRFSSKLDEDKLKEVAANLSADYANISSGSAAIIESIRRIKGNAKKLIGKKTGQELISRANFFILGSILLAATGLFFHIFRKFRSHD